MQNKIYTIALSALILLVGCDDRLKEEVKLDISITSDGLTKEGNVYIVNDSTDVVFNFSGDPDFITFYSGEAGHEYSKKNLTESPIDEITSRLEFSTYAQYGKPQNTLRVYLSTSYDGLYKNNKKADSINVENTTWIDITEECELPNTAGGTSPRISLSLDTYLGKQMTLAFQYYTTDNTVTQSAWEIRDLKIVNTDKVTGSISELKAANLGFTPLDMYITGNAAYNTDSNTGGSGTSGIWNLLNISHTTNPKIRIHSSSAGAVLNNDWLITNPFVANARTPDSGVGIKTVADRLESYTHQFNDPGTYTITIVGRNSNFESTSEIIKEFTIKVEKKK